MIEKAAYTYTFTAAADNTDPHAYDVRPLSVPPLSALAILQFKHYYVASVEGGQLKLAQILTPEGRPHVPIDAVPVGCVCCVCFVCLFAEIRFYGCRSGEREV